MRKTKTASAFKHGVGQLLCIASHSFPHLPPQVGFLAKQEYIYQVYSGTHTTATWTPIYYENSTAVYDWSVTFTDDIANYPQGCFYYGAGGRLLASQVRGGRSCSRCPRFCLA